MNTETKIAVIEELWSITKNVSALYEDDEDELYIKTLQTLAAKTAKMLKGLEQRNAPIDRLMANVMQGTGDSSVTRGRIITPREVLGSTNHD